MQLTALYQISPLLQDYMQKQNFSPPYIKRHVQLLNFIKLRVPIFGWETLENVIHWFENEDHTERYLKDVKKVLFNIEFFHDHGCFPCNGTVKRELLYQVPSLGSHARASHWLEEGMNIVQISFLLGHEHLETTMVYLDITIEQKAEALATLEDELDKIPK